MTQPFVSLPSQPSRDLVDTTAGPLRTSFPWVVAASLGLLAAWASGASAQDSVWVHQGEVTHLSSDLAEAEDADHPNGCEGYIGIPFGDDPSWVRVTRDPSPLAPITELVGQVLDPHDYHDVPNVEGPNGSGMTNAFITHTDNTFTHYGRDLNVFLVLDFADRQFLADGNFEDGYNVQELSNIEIEWERGALPDFAFPAIGDRLRVYGPLIFDCGHGDEGGVAQGDEYRTEIHPPAGWVIYRQTADADGVPQNGKELQSPWQWFEPTDLQGMAITLPTTALFDTPTQASVADVFFSSYGGNAMESLNGCDDNSEPIDADCLVSHRFHNPDSLDTFEWGNDILNQDYAFTVPAPPKPAGSHAAVELTYEIEDMCAGVPANPTFPNQGLLEFEDDPEGPYSDDRGIGAATCNAQNPVVVLVDPEGTAAWNETDLPAIRVLLRLETGADGIDGNGDDPVYPANDYLAYAYRVKVAWNWVPASVTSFRRAAVHLDTLNVFQNGEDATDGEWLMAVRVNEHWTYPVQGDAGFDDNDSDDINEPFYEDGAIEYLDDDEGPSHYNMGAPGTNGIHRIVHLLPGESIRIWDRVVEHDEPDDDDVLPVIDEAIPPAQLGGLYSIDVGGAHAGQFGHHTITVNVGDATLPIPGAASVSFGGNARLDPDTGIWRINGTDPMFVSAPSGYQDVQYRHWRVGTTANPYITVFAPTTPPGAFVLRPLDPAADDTYELEFASLTDHPGGEITVSPTSHLRFELDNTPPVLTVPGDLEVFATETAGAFVEFAVSATDNYDPQPVLDNPVLPTVGCDFDSGDLFPNGANAPKTTTVTCEAIDAVGNSTVNTFDVTVKSPFGYVKDFVALGIEWIEIASSVMVASGNVGAFDTSTGVPNATSFELTSGPSVVFDGGSQLAAESVALGGSNSAGDVFTVDQLEVGNDTTYVSKLGYVPLFLGLPAIPVAGPGGPDLDIDSAQTLAPGAYGRLLVRPNRTLTLAGGAYSFDSVEVKPGARLQADAAATVVVAGRVLFAHGSVTGPSAASGISAHELVLYALGTDGPSGKPADALTFAGQTTVAVNAYAPNGTLRIGTDAQATGAFIGRRVVVGSHAALSWDGAFLIPE